jgi:hypothetical protein
MSTTDNEREVAEARWPVMVTGYTDDDGSRFEYESHENRKLREAFYDGIRFHRQGPVTDEWERRIENRIHYRYGVNSGTYSAFPFGVTASHEEQKSRLEGETSGPVDVTKRESRVVLYGPWEPVEAARNA